MKKYMKKYLKKYAKKNMIEVLIQYNVINNTVMDKKLRKFCVSFQRNSYFLQRSFYDKNK